MAYQSFFEEVAKIEEKSSKPYVSMFKEDGAPTSTISATTGAGIPQNLQPEIPAHKAIKSKDGESDTEDSKRYKELLDNSTSNNN